MRALVTGGAGFIGGTLVGRLVEAGHEVVALDNLSTGHRDNVPHGVGFFREDVEYCDLSRLKQPDVIFHLAARDQPDCFATNIMGTINVLDFAMAAGTTKVIYAGTSSPDPWADPYAWTKHQGEEACRLYHRLYGVNVGLARICNVYGPPLPRQGTQPGFTDTWGLQRASGLPLTVCGPGEQRRGFIHVEDVVSGLIAMAEVDTGELVMVFGDSPGYHRAPRHDAPLPDVILHGHTT